MTVIRSQQSNLLNVMNKTSAMADTCSGASYIASKAAAGITTLQFSGKAAIAGEVMDYANRLNRQQQRMHDYGSAIRNVINEMDAADSADVVSGLGNRILTISDSRDSVFSLTGSEALSRNIAVSGMMMAGGGIFSIFDKLLDKLRKWLADLRRKQSDPEYITNPASELDAIKAEMHNPKPETHWNNLDKNGNTSISCVWFSNQKLKHRGIDQKNNNPPPQYGNGEYENWLKSNSKSSGFTNTSADYIEYLIKNKNNGEPLYNIYIERYSPAEVNKGNAHTMLIDKAWIENGVLKMTFSDNANLKGKSLKPVGSNPDGINTYRPILDPITVTKDQFIKGYSDETSGWAVNKSRPFVIKCFGRV